MEQLKRALTDTMAAIAAEKQKGEERNKELVQELERQEAQLLEQITIAEQGEREQKQTEQLDNLGQQIQDMDLLGAVLPEDQLAATNISLTEYGDMRQSLNQILHAWGTELKQADYKVHNEEVAELQRQLRYAKAESAGYQEHNLQLQRQNEGLQKKFDEVSGELELEKNKREISEAQFHKLGESHKQRNAEVAQLKQQVEELTKQLEESQKPKSSFQASQSVQEQIEGLRKKSSESWADKANRGLARLGLPPIELPDIPAAVPPTEVPESGSTFPAAESADSGIHGGDPGEAKASDSGQVGGTFQDTPDMAGETSGAAGGEVVQQEPVSREEFEALKADVEALKGKVA